VPDRSSPGFAITVIATNPEPRIQGGGDIGLLGQVLDRMTNVSPRVVSFKFIDDEEKHDVLKLVVDNTDLYFFDHPAWVAGNLVQFFFGYPGAIFPGANQSKLMVVDSVRGFHKLTITCVEQTSLANEPVCVLHEDTTRAAIVEKLVAEGAFPGVVRAEIGSRDELEAEGLQTFSQSRQTDWQFIQRLAEKVGFEVYVEGEVLYFARRQLGGRPVRSYEYFYGEGLLIAFDIKEHRVTDRARETTVAGRDPIARERVEATGSNSTTTRDTMGNQSTLIADRGGGLQKAPAGSALVTTPATNQSSVTQEANTHFRRTEQGEVEATARIIGDPLLPAKSVIEIVGISQQFSGKYYIKRVMHEITRRSGYVCKLDLLKNALTNSPSSGDLSLDPTRANENTQGISKDPRLVLVPNRTGGLDQREQ